jgi:hypothetical protein
MKFHQGLAGLLTLLLPFPTVGDTVTEWGIDMTPDEPVNPDKVVGDGRRDRALKQQIQHFPSDQRHLLTPAPEQDSQLRHRRLTDVEG